jgi:hypothetical protein
MSSKPAEKTVVPGRPRGRRRSLSASRQRRRLRTLLPRSKPGHLRQRKVPTTQPSTAYLLGSPSWKAAQHEPVCPSVQVSNPPPMKTNGHVRGQIVRPRASSVQLSPCAVLTRAFVCPSVHPYGGSPSWTDGTSAAGAVRAEADIENAMGEWVHLTRLADAAGSLRNHRCNRARYGGRSLSR